MKKHHKSYHLMCMALCLLTAITQLSNVTTAYAQEVALPLIATEYQVGQSTEVIAPSGTSAETEKTDSLGEIPVLTPAEVEDVEIAAETPPKAETSSESEIPPEANSPPEENDSMEGPDVQDLFILTNDADGSKIGSYNTLQDTLMAVQVHQTGKPCTITVT